jgi:hypothetical protein
VSNGAADSTGGGTLQVVHHVILGARWGGSEEDGSGKSRRHGWVVWSRLFNEKKVSSRRFGTKGEREWWGTIQKEKVKAVDFNEGQTFSNGPCFFLVSYFVTLFLQN